MTHDKPDSFFWEAGLEAQLEREAAKAKLHSGVRASIDIITQS